MISHHHETLFVHIPKCGGQSIEMMFLTDLKLKWATRAPLVMQLNKVRRLGPPSLAHLLAGEYTRFRYMSDKQFETYYKFALVRDPYARVVSHYNFLTNRPKAKASIKLDFDRYIFDWLPTEFGYRTKYARSPFCYTGSYWFVRPQVDYVFGKAGKKLVDDLFRLEDIKAAIPRIKERSGVLTDLAHVNKSKQDKIRLSDLTADHVAVINDLYAPDFRKLDYPLR
jgi:Sulfotransferase family